MEVQLQTKAKAIIGQFNFLTKTSVWVLITLMHLMKIKRKPQTAMMNSKIVNEKSK
jgi:hypothetical protein